MEFENSSDDEEYANSQDYYLNPFDIKSMASCGLSFRCGVLVESVPINIFR
jgi:hypothetical protein